MPNNKKGLLVIISSPSGGGKDSVINAILKIIPNSARLITTTSRQPRPDQKEGIDYYFITPQQFKEKIANDEFVEYNFYAENYYGTEKKELEKTLEKNDLILTQIEVHGKHNFDKKNIPHLSIFLLPESITTLQKRIEKRGGISPEFIKNRMETAKLEIKASADYDYKIVNYEGKLAETIAKITKIIEQEMAKHQSLDKNQ